MYRLPSIRRARDFHFYGYDGTRYLDLWQNQGRAYWGHNPRGLSQGIKNHIPPGLYSPTPHPLFPKALKAAARVFPDYTPWFFPNSENLEKTLHQWGFELPPLPWDTLHWKSQANGKGSLFQPKGSVELWRPDYFPDSAQPSDTNGFGKPDLLCPIIPLPGAFFGALLLIQKSSPIHDDLLNALKIMDPGLLSPIQCIAFTHILNLMDDPKAPHKISTIPPGFPVELPNFIRYNRYLVPQITGEDYFTLYKAARNKKIILNPQEGGISILPAVASPGEWQNIQKCLSEGKHG